METCGEARRSGSEDILEDSKLADTPVDCCGRSSLLKFPDGGALLRTGMGAVDACGADERAGGGGGGRGSFMRPDKPPTVLAGAFVDSCCKDASRPDDDAMPVTRGGFGNEPFSPLIAFVTEQYRLSFWANVSS